VSLAMRKTAFITEESERGATPRSNLFVGLLGRGCYLFVFGAGLLVRRGNLHLAQEDPEAPNVGGRAVRNAFDHLRR
jgi:hypothetical protein